MKKKSETKYLGFKKSKMWFIKGPKNRYKSRTPHQEKCSVSGATYLMLHMSRFIGIAPVCFKDWYGERLVCVSPTVWGLGLLIVFVLDILCATGILLDLLLPPQTSERAGDPTVRFVWIIEVTIIMVSLTVSVYKSPKTMEVVIRSLNRLYKFHMKGNYKRTATQELKKCIAIIIFVVIAIYVNMRSFVELVSMDAKIIDRQIAIMYSTFYIATLIIDTIEMQFIFTTMEVQCALKSLNNELEEVEHLIQQQGKKVLLPNNFLYEGTTESANPLVKFVNIKMLGNSNISACRTNTRLKSSKPPETLHHIIIKYHQLYSMMTQLSSCFGASAFSVIALCLLNIVTGPYKMFMIMDNDQVDKPGLLEYVAICVWYFFCTIAVVEPCHKIHVEMERTNWLVAQLVLESNDQRIQDELERFSNYLVLNSIGFSPLGAFTFSRRLVVSILGTVATYLVIVFQFRSLENSNK